MIFELNFGLIFGLICELIFRFIFEFIFAVKYHVNVCFLFETSGHYGMNKVLLANKPQPKISKSQVFMTSKPMTPSSNIYFSQIRCGIFVREQFRGIHFNRGFKSSRENFGLVRTPFSSN